MSKENIEYMGDGVYAEFTGYSIDIRVNDHRNPVSVSLEPQVLEAIVSFQKRKQHQLNQNKDEH